MSPTNSLGMGEAQLLSTMLHQHTNLRHVT